MKPFLQSLHVKNFQIHKDLKIEFAPITTIVGESDQGKSSVYRSIRWVALNAPRGTSYINTSAKEASVFLQTKKGSVSRKRGKTLNVYEAEGHKLEAFGNNTPEEVRDILGLDSINFQGQYDPPFWFTLSSGEVSRNLNKIVNLEKIDQSLSSIDSIVRKSKMRMEIKKEELDQKKKEKSQLLYVREAYSEFKKIRSSQKEVDEILEKEKQLEEHINSIVQFMNILDKGVKKYEQGMELLELGNRWKDLFKREDLLTDLVKSITLFQKYSNFRIPSINSIEESMKDIEILKKREGMLKEIIENIEEERRTICEGSRTLEKWEKNFSLKMGKVCPLCKRKIK